MQGAAARWVAGALSVVSFVLAVAGSWLDFIGDPFSSDLDYGVGFFAVFLVFTLVGALIAFRRSENAVGWFLIVEGLLWQLAGVLAAYANYSLFVEPGSLPGGSLAAWVLNWVWIPTLGIVPFLFLLFPDGRLPSGRWRLIPWLTTLGVALGVAGSALTPGPMGNAFPIRNPFGLKDGTWVLRAVEMSASLLIAVAIVASIVLLVLKLRRARGIERLQIKWLAYAGALVIVAFTVGDVVGALGLPVLAANIQVPSLLAIPLGMGIAVLRYRLYDIDTVVIRTVVLGGLAAFITAVYLAMVVFIGAVVGWRSDSNILLAVVATALVAVTFQPVLHRLQRLARRLVFGGPSTAEEQAGIAILTLGAFRVLQDGELVSLRAWQSKKARTLLKILLARRGRSTTRDLLMELLWPEESSDMVTRRLSVALATVRAVLDPTKRHRPHHFIVGDSDAVRLDLTHLPVDVEQFLVNAAEGLALRHSGRAGEARAMLRTAQALYAGDFLEEDRYEDWAVPLREEARATYISVARALADLAQDSGDPDEAVRYFVRILEIDGWDEGAHLGLVSTLERAGRHGEARRCYRSYLARMEEIGVRASPFPSSERS